MQAYHDAFVDSPQRDTFLSMFERPKETAGGACSLCLREAENIKTHLAHHLEQVALFALPRVHEMPDMDSGANAKGSKESSSMMKSSLDFESQQSRSDVNTDEENELQGNTLSAKTGQGEGPTQQTETPVEEHSIDPSIPSSKDLANYFLPLELGTIKNLEENYRTLQSDFWSWQRVLERMKSTSTEPRDRTEAFISWVHDNVPDQRIRDHHLPELPHHDLKNLIIHDQLYRSWEASPDRSLMIYGVAGCGKTVLTSVLIQRLSQYCAAKMNAAVLYVFCGDFLKMRISTGDLLQGLVFQLLSQSQERVPLLEEHQANSQLEHRPSSLEFLITKIHSHFEDVYIVIDDLNAGLQIPGFEHVLQELLSRKGSHVLHILTTTRHDQDIRARIFGSDRDLIKFGMQETLIENYIAAYIRDRLCTDPALEFWRDEIHVKSEIERNLLAKCKGM